MIPRNRLVFLFLMLHSSFCVLILQAQETRSQPGVVVQVEGQLKFKRPGWTVYAPVVFGKYLYPGDLLDLSKSSNAKVVCSDLTLHQVPTGIGAVPCPASREVLMWRNRSTIFAARYIGPTRESFINATRGGSSDGSFPVVLSPRKTKLISTHPTLRWTPVGGATAYKVIVRGGNLRWSTVVTSGTEFVYPQNAPQLDVGVYYTLIVVAEEGHPGNEAGLAVGFSLLDAKNQKVVLEEQKQIENLGLPEGPTQFLIAHLYADRGLYAEAIERLEGVSESFRRAAVQKLLGDLHMHIALPREAEADYLHSLELARSENDDEGQMLLHQALASIYEHTLRNKELAVQHLNATLDLARRLGDASAANQAEKQLAEVKTASPSE